MQFNKKVFISIIKHPLYSQNRNKHISGCFVSSFITMFCIQMAITLYRCGEELCTIKAYQLRGNNM